MWYINGKEIACRCSLNPSEDTSKFPASGQVTALAVFFFPSFATLLVRIKTILNTDFIQPAFILDTAHAFIWNRPTLSRPISLYRPHGNNLQILFQDTSLSRPSPLRCHHLASVLSVDLYPLPSLSLSLKEVYLSNASGLSSPLLTILACNAEMAETLDRFLPFFILKV